MSQVHTVVAGDCLCSIAKLYGFTDYRVIYEHPLNANLRRTRQDPYVLFPGDSVIIPDKKDKSDSKATAQTHRFVIKRPDVQLKLQLTLNDKPRANLPYEIVIDGIATSGQTDGSGWIKVKIAPDAAEGKLTLTKTGEEYQLQLGHLDPVEEDTGVAARLQNLGFYSGPLDTPSDAAIQGALQRFQESQNLPISGTADSATRAALRSAHGS